MAAAAVTVTVAVFCSGPIAFGLSMAETDGPYDLGSPNYAGLWVLGLVLLAALAGLGAVLVLAAAPRLRRCWCPRLCAAAMVPAGLIILFFAAELASVLLVP